MSYIITSSSTINIDNTRSNRYIQNIETLSTSNITVSYFVFDGNVLVDSNTADVDSSGVVVKTKEPECVINRVTDTVNIDISSDIVSADSNIQISTTQQQYMSDNRYVKYSGLIGHNKLVQCIAGDSVKNGIFDSHLILVDIDHDNDFSNILSYADIELSEQTISCINTNSSVSGHNILENPRITGMAVSGIFVYITISYDIYEQSRTIEVDTMVMFAIVNNMFIQYDVNRQLGKTEIYVGFEYSNFDDCNIVSCIDSSTEEYLLSIRKQDGNTFVFKNNNVINSNDTILTTINTYGKLTSFSSKNSRFAITNIGEILENKDEQNTRYNNYEIIIFSENNSIPNVMYYSFFKSYFDCSSSNNIKTSGSIECNGFGSVTGGVDYGNMAVFKDCSAFFIDGYNIIVNYMNSHDTTSSSVGQNRIYLLGNDYDYNIVSRIAKDDADNDKFKTYTNNAISTIYSNILFVLNYSSDFIEMSVFSADVNNNSINYIMDIDIYSMIVSESGINILDGGNDFTKLYITGTSNYNILCLSISDVYGDFTYNVTIDLLAIILKYNIIL